MNQQQHSSQPQPRLTQLLTTAKALGVTVAALVAGCASSPMPGPTSPAAVALPPGAPPSNSVTAVPKLSPKTAPYQAAQTSGAATPKAYRRDAASHLYALNAGRIYQGKLPPMLYAIGVLEVEVDGQGKVKSTHWLRAPSHAPEVVAEIERTVRQAQPYPAPARMGKVVYTDTWLWHESGQFQLDTLTEGQL